MSATRRWLFAVLVFVGLSAPAFGQIKWNFTYGDSAGSGFNNNTIDAGETLSRGQLRRASVEAAGAYLSSILDGRGTINANFEASQFGGDGFLAAYGPQQFIGINGSFQNGGFYQAARTNDRLFGGDDGLDGSGLFDFGFAWNYAGQSNSINTNAYDMVTVAIHELGHGLGFLSLADQNGLGLSSTNNTVGNPDLYSGYDRFLQRGNGALSSSGLFNTNINSTGYGSFTGNSNTFTNGNNTSTGLFFGGKYAREVFFDRAIPLYAPGTYNDGSSVSHVNDSSAVMNPSVTANTVKRFQAYEIAMLMDIGWNVYNWNSTGGNWSDGVNANGTFTLANSHWRTDSGIVADDINDYNTHANQGEAPVLPVYGKDTANIVLNFKGSGDQNYTSTNDLPHAVRLSRLNLNSTSSNTITIAGGTLNFGLNSDGTPSVLAPKIVQSGSGAINISSTIQTNTVATYSQTYNANTSNEATVTYRGHSGVTIDGAGTGTVTLSGNVVGTGGITKDGADFTAVLSGNNSYTGVTTAKGGVLSVNTLANGGVVYTIGTTTDSTIATVNSTTGLSVGMTLSTANVAFGTTITAINTATNEITLSQTATATGSAISATIGTANGIGISTNAASNLVIGGGTLRYTGAAVSTDRLFSLGYGTNGTATGTFENNGTGAVAFTNTGSLGFGTDTQTVEAVTNNSNTITLFPGGADKVQVGQTVTGTGIDSGTTITAVDTTTGVITLSKNATSTGTFRDLTFAGGDRSLGLSGTYTGGTNSLAAVIANPGVGTFATSVSKTGAGTWALSGNNTYTGSTSVSAGTLYVNGDQTSATGNVTVSGGKLAGSGTLGGAVNVNSGGTLEAGNAGLGTLTVKNNVTVNSGGTLRAELGSSGSADLLAMNSGSHTLDLKSGTTLALVADGFSGTTFTLADLNGTTDGLLKIDGTNVAANSTIAVFTSSGGNNGTDNNANLNFSLSGFNLNSGDKLSLRRDSAGDLVLVFTPVPEPAGLLAVVGLATGGGLAWRRWRGKKTLAA